MLDMRGGVEIRCSWQEQVVREIPAARVSQRRIRSTKRGVSHGGSRLSHGQLHEAIFIHRACGEIDVG